MLHESLSYTDVLNHLRGLCQKRANGTLYILDGAHLLERIGLQKGEIVFLYGANTEGVKSLSNMHRGKGSQTNFSVYFTDGATLSTRMDLPTTTEILALLEDALPDNKSSHSAQTSTLSSDTKTILEQTLKEYVGPIATMICSDCFSSVSDLESAIETLATEIPDHQAAERFREQARRTCC